MGFNTAAFSVAIMGDFSVARPPAVAVRALERLLAWRLDVAHVNPAGWNEMTSAGGDTTRYAGGVVVRLHDISGHRDTGITACPGQYLYSLLPQIRTAVAAMGLPKFYKPSLPLASIVSGVPENMRIRANGSARLTWSVTVLDPSGDVFVTLPTQTGRALDLLWPGGGTPAQPTEPGIYEILIAASASGAVARSALLPFTVRPAPSPSPSPSPTISPSPTVTPTP